MAPKRLYPGDPGYYNPPISTVDETDINDLARDTPVYGSGNLLKSLFGGGAGRSLNGGDRQRYMESAETSNDRGFPPQILTHNLVGDRASIGGTAANPLDEMDLLGPDGVEPLEWANVMANALAGGTVPSVGGTTPSPAPAPTSFDRFQPPQRAPRNTTTPKAKRPPDAPPEASETDVSGNGEAVDADGAVSRATGLEALANWGGRGVDWLLDKVLDVDESVVNAIDKFVSRAGPEQDARQKLLAEKIKKFQDAYSGNIGTEFYNWVYDNDEEAPPESVRQRGAEPADTAPRTVTDTEQSWEWMQDLDELTLKELVRRGKHPEMVAAAEQVLMARFTEQMKTVSPLPAVPPALDPRTAPIPQGDILNVPSSPRTSPR